MTVDQVMELANSVHGYNHRSSHASDFLL
jgi:hypothetical protein